MLFACFLEIGGTSFFIIALSYKRYFVLIRLKNTEYKFCIFFFSHHGLECLGSLLAIKKNIPWTSTSNPPFPNSFKRERMFNTNLELENYSNVSAGQSMFFVNHKIGPWDVYYFSSKMHPLHKESQKLSSNDYSPFHFTKRFGNCKLLCSLNTSATEQVDFSNFLQL